jgi:hypothetical protein
MRGIVLPVSNAKGTYQIPDPTLAPEAHLGRWFRDAAQLRAFREVGALLIHGTKPQY